MFPHIPAPAEVKKLSFHKLEDENWCKNPGSRMPVYSFVKRLMDIVLSALALVLFAPFWILLILFIRLDSKGPAIFSHMRAGKNGKLFRLYKFRTMSRGVAAHEFAPTTLKDPRITRMGRFMRRTSLDEMPQLWNIMKGEMSLVGPRPEMEFIVKKYRGMQSRRLLVKPGLTGLWQVLGRKDLPLHENAEYDYYYILHRSLWLDLWILLKTVGAVLYGKGAY